MKISAEDNPRNKEVILTFAIAADEMLEFTEEETQYCRDLAACDPMAGGIALCLIAWHRRKMTLQKERDGGAG